jgi:gluconate 5-dehydrogenase
MSIQRRFDLTGRVALLTGSTRGLGFAMAEALGEAGAHVILNGRTNETVGQALAALAGKGVSCEGLAFDASLPAAGREAVADIIARHGRLDILVANAGSPARAALEDWTLDRWDEVMGLNLRGAFFLAQAAAAPMQRQRSGRIILTASITGILGRATIHGYAASKAGLASVARSLAAELGAFGITCNSLSPGYFETDLNAALVKDPAFNDRVVTRTALKRWGRPEEIAGLALLLASDAGSYITGQQLVVDGGFTGTM